MSGLRSAVGRTIRSVPGGRGLLEQAFGGVSRVRRGVADAGGRASLDARVTRARRHPELIRLRRRAAAARLDARIRRDGLDTVIDELLDPNR